MANSNHLIAIKVTKGWKGERGKRKERWCFCTQKGSLFIFRMFSDFKQSINFWPNERFHIFYCKQWLRIARGWVKKVTYDSASAIFSAIYALSAFSTLFPFNVIQGALNLIAKRENGNVMLRMCVEIGIHPEIKELKLCFFPWRKIYIRWGFNALLLD